MGDSPFDWLTPPMSIAQKVKDCESNGTARRYEKRSIPRALSLLGITRHTYQKILMAPTHCNISFEGSPLTQPCDMCHRIVGIHTTPPSHLYSMTPDGFMGGWLPRNRYSTRVPQFLGTCTSANGITHAR